MADGSMVRYNFAAMESAISSFTASSAHIVELTGNLRANASAIQSAVVSNASDVYAGKMEALAGNFSRAEERLTAEVQKLKLDVEKARAAEQTATSIAEQVSTFPMD